jgi:hypothetical protein
VFEDAIATSNGKNKRVAYTANPLDSTRNTQKTAITTNLGHLLPLRGAYVVPIADGVFDSDVLPTAPRDPRGSRYYGAFLSNTDYQLFGAKENPDTKTPTAVVRGSFKQGMILDILIRDIDESVTDIPVANPSRFVKDDVIRIDNEYMEVVSFNTVAKTLKVTRGCNADASTCGTLTSQKIHNKGASVYITTLNPKANSLLCITDDTTTGGWAAAHADLVVVAASSANWDTNMEGVDKTGLVCLDGKTITDESNTYLPYRVTTE